VVRVAQEAGVRKVVVTSTAGILGPSTHGQTVDENIPPPDSFFSTYESSKYQMEQELKKINPEDIEIVIVNPTRVYGPGLLSVSNGVTKMIKMYLKDNWRYLPGNGYQYGNYVFVEDVVTGLLLAMERGKPGERYILGGENLTYRQLFQLVRENSNIKRKLFPVPLLLMLIFAAVIKSLSRITGRPPLIVPELVRKFNHHWIVSSEKAIREIGYNPVTADKGIGMTVNWIKENF
jgi:farnesol dehydrogenase